MNDRDLNNTKNYELAVLLPTLNEEECIIKILSEVKKVLSDMNVKSCVVISDNESDDNTLKKVENENLFINKEKKRGYGSNLISGLSKIKSQYVIFFDSDGSYDPKEIPKYYDEIKKNDLDMITGNRLVNMEKNAMPFLNRYFGTPILTFLIRLFYKTKMYDCNSGMKCFKTEALNKLNLKANGMEFASEILIKSAKNNLKSKEIIINFRKDYRNRPPHLQRWTDGWRHLKFIYANAPEKFIYYPFFLILSIYCLILFFSIVLKESLPRYHTVIALITLNQFLAFTLVSILIFRSKLFVKDYLKCSIIEKIFMWNKKSFFVNSFYFLIIIFLIEFFSIFLNWVFVNFGLMDNLFTMARLAIYAQLASITIMLDIAFNNEN